MRVIIPAAGKGTRLRPHSFVRPKSLLEVAGKTILDHLLTILEPAGITEVAMVVNPGDTMIEPHVRRQYDIPFRLYPQETPKGLAHAIMTAGAELVDEPVLIILGDTIVDTDFKQITGQGCSVLGVKEVDDPRRFGVAVVGSDGYITRVEEKNPSPRSNLALIGLYYIHCGSDLKSAIQELIDRDIKTKGEYQITDALQLMIERGDRFKTVAVDGWYDAGTVDAVLKTHYQLLKLAPQARSTDTCLITGPVFVHETATVERAVLGPGVSVGSGAIVRDAVIRDSIIGQNSVVEDSVLEQSLIGEDVRVSGIRHRMNIADTSIVQA